MENESDKVTMIKPYPLRYLIPVHEINSDMLKSQKALILQDYENPLLSGEYRIKITSMH